jgi:glycosyltransferase involved in cell wall biosynthesis
LTSHILIVASWYTSGRGSGGGYFRDQALALQAAGHRVAILAPDIYTWRDLRSGRLPRGTRRKVTIEDDGVPVYRRSSFTALPRLPYRNPLTWTRCGMQLARHYITENGRPDLVHAHCCLHAGVLALAINRCYGIPYIVTEHSTGFAQGRLRWWERDLVRRVIRRARRCIAVSPHLAALLEEQYRTSVWQYVPNVLGEAFLGAGRPVVQAADERPFVFLCVARLSPEKGCDVLITAFATAFRTTPGVRLRLVGDGPMRPSLEQLALRLGIADKIDFVGLRSGEDVRAEMYAADAFVLASRFESFGVVVIEALACGLPVVATASGGPDHLIAPDNGVLVPCGDVAALRDAMREMRVQAPRYDRRAIRAEVIRQYGPDAFARQFAAIIA